MTRARMRAGFLLGFSLAALCFATWVVDQTSGISASWLYCGSVMVIGAGLSAITFMRHRLRFALRAGTGFLGCILVLHFCDTTPAKPFRRLEAAVQNGMTLAEVRLAEQLEFPETGRFPVPIGYDSVPESGIGQMWIMNSPFGFSIIVQFIDGRVIRKHSSLTPISDMDLPKIAVLVATWVCFMCWRCERRIFGVTPWVGHGIDLGSVAERLQGVRRDYLGEYRTRHNVACQRRDLLAAAGLAVRRFPYFRGRTAEGVQTSESDEPQGPCQNRGDGIPQ